MTQATRRPCPPGTGPRRIARHELGSVLPPGGLSLVSGCSAESLLLADMVEIAGDVLGGMTFFGVFVPRVNRAVWRAGPDGRTLTLFQTPELRAQGDRVDFLPLCYEDALAELRRRTPAAALFMCAPPDAAGNCSFGTEVSFIAELWRDIPTRIAHINPSMPFTTGDPGIPFDQLTAFIEQDQPLAVLAGSKRDAAIEAIAAHLAPFVHDGDTLQVGIGRVPDAVARALVGCRSLSVRSGLLGDGLMDLIESGAVDRAVVGTAVGSPALYTRLDHPALEFRPVSITHGADELRSIDRFVTINSAMAVDLFGQAYAEMDRHGFISGPGGASDFTRAARGRGGTRIIALPASAGSASRIVAPGQGQGPVSLGRFDIDVVVTQFGAADLRGLGHDQRAMALTAIADPLFRNDLARDWVEHLSSSA